MNKGVDIKNSSKSGKKINIFRIPLPIPSKLSKKVLEKSKFYKSKSKASASQAETQHSFSYT